MGEDKSLLPFGGYNTLAEFQYRRLSPYFSKTYISSKSNKFDFDANIIYDIVSDVSSPMIALKSILSSVDSDFVFILPIDSPLITIKSINEIIINSINNQITVAKTEKIHNLCGVFSTNIHSEIDHFLLKNNHKINDLIFSLKYGIIGFLDEIEFSNINYKSEYNEIFKKSLEDKF